MHLSVGQCLCSANQRLKLKQSRPQHGLQSKLRPRSATNFLRTTIHASSDTLYSSTKPQKHLSCKSNKRVERSRCIYHATLSFIIVFRVYRSWCHLFFIMCLGTHVLMGVCYVLVDLVIFAYCCLPYQNLGVIIKSRSTFAILVPVVLCGPSWGTIFRFFCDVRCFGSMCTTAGLWCFDLDHLSALRL